MSKETKIDLIVLTGFFGSGKTTLLHHLLTQYPEKKTGIIMNDFGAFHIDRELLEDNDIQMDELVHGSVFCSCLSEHFKASMISYSKSDIDCLIVESSGLSDPSNMGKLLEQISTSCQRAYEYRGVICVVDGKNFTESIEEFHVIRNQLQCSNFIVVNKSDLLDEKDQEKMKIFLQQLSPESIVYFTEYGKIPYTEIEEKLVFNQVIGETINVRELAPEVYSLESAEVSSLEGLESFLSEICKYTVRIKGYANVSGQTYYEEFIDGEKMIIEKSGRFYDGKTRIVMIGYDQTDFYDKTRLLWEKYVGTDYKLYD